MNSAHLPPDLPGTSRRDFLKKSAAAAAVSAALAPLEIGRSAHAGGSDVLRVGMIGCGGRNAGAVVQALKADRGAQLVAMCDLFSDRIEAKRAAIRSEKPQQVRVINDHCFTGFDGYKNVIECSDVVLVANAAKFHPLHLMAAVEAGQHVFVEKPHAIDPAGIKVVKAACLLAQQKKLSVMSGLHSRHHPGYIETIQRIHDGAIGEIVALEENFLRSPYGVIGRKPGLTELEWQLSAQYRFRWLSGDDVVQSLVHNLDRTSWVLGNKVPLKCHGLGGRSSMLGPIHGDVFDHHSVVYEFENGPRVYALCRTTAGCYDEDSSLIFGSKGKASLKSCRISGETTWRWQGRCDPYQVEHDRLFAAIRSGEPLNNGDYMARSTMITVMGQISCYTGKEVTWEQVNQSDFCYAPRPEECHDGMEAPTNLASDNSCPVPIPGQTRFDLQPKSPAAARTS